MIVLEELDRAKKGLSEVSRNVRQVSRFIGELMASPAMKLEDGLALSEPDGLNLKVGTGRLYFQTERFDNGAELIGDRSLADNEILLAALSLIRKHPDKQIILVSKDINLRIKATIHGVRRGLSQRPRPG
jgi:PhoH-like ATPase